MFISNQELKKQLGLSNRSLVGVIGSRLIDAQTRDDIDRIIGAIIIKRGYAFVSGGAIGTDKLVRQVVNNMGRRIIEVVTKTSHASNHNYVIPLYPENVVIEPRDYLRRNDLLASIVDILVVVKASRYSGTVYTANKCIALNKKVYVSDLHLNDSGYEGNMYLLKHGCRPLSELIFAK